MTQPTMNLDERRRADHQLAVQRRQARAEYVEQAEIEAKADADYRRIKSTTFLECRDQGLPANGAEIVANAAAAAAKQKRDIAAALAKAALLKVQETERESVSVRDIHTSSERIDGLAI